MSDRYFSSITKALHKDRFAFLTILIVALIVLGGFSERFIKLSVFMELFFSIIFIASIYAASQKRNHLIIAIILIIPTLLSLWLEDIAKSDTLFTIGYICGSTIFAFAVILILKFVFSQQVITRQTISAAVVVYLLMALMWAFIYRLIAILLPASFAIANSELHDAANVFVYFSLVTITTLGYGDITPVSSQAIALAVLEAVTGQIYLVVVVAWFVGMYVSRKSKP